MYYIRELKYSDYNNFLNLINEFRQTNFTEKEFIKNLDKINKNSKILVITNKFFYNV